MSHLQDIRHRSAISGLAEDNARLRERLAIAEEQVKQLLAELGTIDPAPLCFGLSSQQVAIFGIIMRRPFAPASLIATAVSASFHGKGGAATYSSIAAQICYIRRKLRPFGIVIHNRFGDGYFMAEADKAAVCLLVAREVVTERIAA